VPEDQSKQVPRALKVAAVVVALEGLLGIGLGVAEAADIDRDRWVNGLTTAVFLLLYGAGLLVVARGLSRAASWSRGPAVFAQLIQLGVGWSFWGGSTTWVALVLAVAGIVVLAAIFQRASIEALVDRSPPHQ
jgi:hypothetical protein